MNFYWLIFWNPCLWLVWLVTWLWQNEKWQKYNIFIYIILTGFFQTSLKRQTIFGKDSNLPQFFLASCGLLNPNVALQSETQVVMWARVSTSLCRNLGLQQPTLHSRLHDYLTVVFVSFSQSQEDFFEHSRDWGWSNNEFIFADLDIGKTLIMTMRWKEISAEDVAQYFGYSKRAMYRTPQEFG